MGVASVDQDHRVIEASGTHEVASQFNNRDRAALIGVEQHAPRALGGSSAHIVTRPNAVEADAEIAGGFDIGGQLHHMHQRTVEPSGGDLHGQAHHVSVFQLQV